MAEERRDRQLEAYLKLSPIKIPKNVVLLTGDLDLQYGMILKKLMESSDHPDRKVDDPGFFNLRHLRSLKDIFKTERKNELMDLYYFLVGFFGFESFSCGQLDKSDQRDLVANKGDIGFLARLIGQEIKLYATDPVIEKKKLNQAQLILSGAAHANILHGVFYSGSSVPLTLGYTIWRTAGSESYSGMDKRIQLSYRYYRDAVVYEMQTVRAVLVKK